MESDLTRILESQHALWVLIDPSGTANIAVPFHMPSEEVFGSSGPPEWADLLGSPLAPSLEVATHFLNRHPGWAVLVSALREAPAVVAEAVRLLHRSRSKALTDAEYSILTELGLDFPFGDWARQERATIYVVR